MAELLTTKDVDLDSIAREAEQDVENNSETLPIEKFTTMGDAYEDEQLPIQEFPDFDVVQPVKVFNPESNDTDCGCGCNGEYSRKCKIKGFLRENLMFISVGFGALILTVVLMKIVKTK